MINVALQNHDATMELLRCSPWFNPLTAGAAYIRVFSFFISTLSTTF